MKRTLITGLILSWLAFPIAAVADGQNWAIGKWEGKLLSSDGRGAANGQYIALTITTVAPGGLAQGSWTAGATTYHPAIQVDGDTIQVAKMQLRKMSGDQLSGTTSGNGRSYTIALKRSE